MTLFEYIAIAYCLILSFAVARASSVIPHALAEGRRYWVHATWVFANLCCSLVAFWNFWSFRDVEWTLGGLVLALATPTSLLVVASVLAPDEPSRVESWREYYYSVRVRIFSCGLAWVAAMTLTTTLLLEMGLLHPARIVQVIMLIYFGVGILSDRPRVHETLAGLAFVIMLIFIPSIFLFPGALASVD